MQEEGSNKRIRHLSRKEWKEIQEKRVVEREISLFGFSGKSALLTMEKVTSPVRAGETIIVEKGISWLQIALHGARFWVTAMFTEEGELFECYVDVTNGNFVSGEIDPYFLDEYLDYLLSPAGVEERDREELFAAHSSGKISKEEFLLALKTGEEVLSYLTENQKEVLSFLQEEYIRLKNTSSI